MMRTIDLTTWDEEFTTKLRFKAYLNGNGNVADYLRNLIFQDHIQMRSPKKMYCFHCHHNQIFTPTTNKDNFKVNVDGTTYDIIISDFPGDRCSQCGTVYESVSLGAAFEAIIIQLISQKKVEGSSIPEVISLNEWLFDNKQRNDIDGDLIVFKKSELANLILSYGNRLDVAESKNVQITILAKMELLSRLIHSEGSDLSD